MKQGLKISLPVKIQFDLDLVDSIEFLFKQSKLRDDQTVKKYSVYNQDGSGDAKRQGDIIYVPWEVEETYAFEPEDDFYMDTRIHLIDSPYNPETNIVRLTMSPTLFQREEV